MENDKRGITRDTAREKGAYAKEKKEISIYHPPIHVLLKISKSSEIKSIEFYNYYTNKP